jgi:uncharacterized protein DUF4240
MSQAQFWTLIEEAKRESGGECEPLVERLQTKLSRLPETEIIAFAETLAQLLDEAYTWELWAAAYIINGGCSDDGFEYFRRWLIGQGEQIFRSAVDDPESLADFPGQLPADAECEELGYAAEQAYEEKTGHKMPPYQLPPFRSEPQGKPWEEGEEEQLYPRLAARVEHESAVRQ